MMLSCSRCKKELPLENFCKKNNTRGFQYSCKSCMASAQRQWKINNPLRIKEISKKAYLKDREKQIQDSMRYWSSRSPEDRAAYLRKYRQNNPKVKFRETMKYFKRLKRTPPWLTPTQKEEIKNFYLLRDDARILTGENYHVDHIIPLQGKLICGLHVPWNLQVLPASINLSKNNSYEVG